MLGASTILSQVTGPIFPTTIQSGGFTKYDTNGYPYVNATGITIDTSSLTNLTVSTATNGLSTAIIGPSGNYSEVSATKGLWVQTTNSLVSVSNQISLVNAEALLNSISNLLYSPLLVGITNATIDYADIGSNGLGSASSKPIWSTNTIGSAAATPGAMIGFLMTAITTGAWMIFAYIIEF